jgi:5-methylcytosine-specific restriction endonuclease McrA
MTLRRTEIRRISAKRQAEFDKLGVRPGSTLDKPDEKRKAMVKRYTDTGPDEATVKLVLERDRWKCVPCGDPIYGRRGVEWCVSHRKLRAQGVDNRPPNLMASCMPCERLIHDHPERARQAGWMLRSTEDPETVAVEHSQHGRVFLTNDGGFSPAPEEEASA